VCGLAVDTVTMYLDIKILWSQADLPFSAPGTGGRMGGSPTTRRW
jgi:hypothetical protein